MPSTPRGSQPWDCTFVSIITYWQHSPAVVSLRIQRLWSNSANDASTLRVCSSTEQQELMWPPRGSQLLAALLLSSALLAEAAPRSHINDAAITSQQVWC